MIIVDANVLIYAVDEHSAHHADALKWLESVLSQNEVVGLTWVVLLAFLRLTTKSRFFRNPLTVDRAFEIIGEWLDHSSISLIEAGPRHFQILRGLLVKSGAEGNLTTDAHLAAIAIEHSAQLCSFDHDFARFAGLHWFTPSKH